MENSKSTGQNKKEEKKIKKNGYGKTIYEHKYTRRSRKHDYTKPTTYHIILKKEPECVSFGNSAGNPKITPGERGSAFILLSALGKIINEEIFNWTERYPVLKVYQHIVMPDHVHILVRVLVEIPKGFGFYVNRLKTDIKFRWNESQGTVMPAVFEEGYTDKIIYSDRSLSDIITYIKHNPHRLMIRIIYPGFFERRRNIRIGDECWEAYGNIFLIRNPFKQAVIVHRKDTDEEFKDLKDSCLDNAHKEGVIVSAFISKREKEIRDAIIEAKGRIIYVQETPFGDRFKPEKSRFEQCSEGRMLILAPLDPLKEESQRQRCLHLNRIAEAMAAGDFTV